MMIVQVCQRCHSIATLALEIEDDCDVDAQGEHAFERREVVVGDELASKIFSAERWNGMLEALAKYAPLAAALASILPRDRGLEGLLMFGQEGAV